MNDKKSKLTTKRRSETLTAAAWMLTIYGIMLFIKNSKEFFKPQKNQEKSNSSMQQNDQTNSKKNLNDLKDEEPPPKRPFLVSFLGWSLILFASFILVLAIRQIVESLYWGSRWRLDVWLSVIIFIVAGILISLGSALLKGKNLARILIIFLGNSLLSLMLALVVDDLIRLDISFMLIFGLPIIIMLWIIWNLSHSSKIRNFFKIKPKEIPKIVTFIGITTTILFELIYIFSIEYFLIKYPKDNNLILLFVLAFIAPPVIIFAKIGGIGLIEGKRWSRKFVATLWLMLFMINIVWLISSLIYDAPIINIVAETLSLIAQWLIISTLIFNKEVTEFFKEHENQKNNNI